MATKVRTAGCQTIIAWLYFSTIVRISRAIDTTECALNVPQPLQNHGRFGCPLPIDETAPSIPTTWSPWSHPPQCVNATKNSTEKYCVYTNSRHGIEGVSLITTPRAAADSVDLLNEPILPSVRLDSFEKHGAPLPYKIAEIPGKGLGVVATRPIEQYETLMVDYASMVVDLSFPHTVSRDEGYKLLHKATDQLADPNKVLKLATSIKEAGDIIENVLRTNAYQTELAGLPHMVLFPTVCRMNHACRPNAFLRFVPNSLAVSVAAGRRIEAGEEITVSYLNVGQTFIDRQKALERWGFKCSCDLCTASSEEVAASDTRRLQIQNKYGHVYKAYQAGEAERAISLTKEILELMKKEDLFQLYSEQYENLGRIYWASGDKANAIKYAKKSLDILEQQGHIQTGPRYLKMVLDSFQNL